MSHELRAAEAVLGYLRSLRVLSVRRGLDFPGALIKPCPRRRRLQARSFYFCNLTSARWPRYR